MACSNLEHDQYEVLPAERNGHCLFLCFVDILRERNVAGRPCTHQAMRGAIADYFDQHGGTVAYRGVQYPCDEAIRSNGYGGVTEALAFAAMYSISIEMHCPETSDVVQEISCGRSDVGAELLLQTLAWEENGRRAPAGDHWQRLRKKAAAAAHHRPDDFSINTHEGDLCLHVPPVASTPHKDSTVVLNRSPQGMSLGHTKPQEVIGAAAAAEETPNPNPHDTPALANRTGSTMTNISNGKINFDDIISDSISTIIPAGPSDATRSKLQDVSRACGSTNEFCKHNQSDLQKACGDITNQSSCAQKCCCGWVKFGDKGDKGAQGDKGGSTMMSDARSSALNGFGISPDGKCVAGGASGPELTFNRDIDYYYYMGECMKGVCKSKGT